MTFFVRVFTADLIALLYIRCLSACRSRLRSFADGIQLISLAAPITGEWTTGPVIILVVVRERLGCLDAEVALKHITSARTPKNPAANPIAIFTRRFSLGREKSRMSLTSMNFFLQVIFFCEQLSPSKEARRRNEATPKARRQRKEQQRARRGMAPFPSTPQPPPRKSK